MVHRILPAGATPALVAALDCYDGAAADLRACRDHEAMPFLVYRLNTAYADYRATLARLVSLLPPTDFGPDYAPDTDLAALTDPYYGD